jgi:sugar lactone lactonase YvrE
MEYYFSIDLLLGTLGAAYNQLHTPQFISRDLNTNTLYIADYDNNRVMSYASGASTGTLIIGGQGAGINNTQLNGPVGIYFDSISNNLYICNYLGHHIVRWTFGATSWTLVVGTPGVFGSSSTLLSFPNGITLDPMGNLYVADTRNNRIQLFLAGQTVATTIAGITGSPGSSSVQLNSPYSVRLDNQLNLYVADLTNNRIQKFLRY